MILKTSGASVIFLDSKRLRLASMRKTIYNGGMEIQKELSQDKSRRWIPWFITLTYRRKEDWRANHVKDYLKRIRSWLYRRGLPMIYLWVAELQKRGAVHYHVLLWVPKGQWLPYSDRQGWWTHGSTNAKPARKAVGYMMKYVSKEASKDGHDFPKGARIYGVGGLTDLARRVIRYWKAPKWFRKHLPVDIEPSGFDLHRENGGWIDRISGFCRKTPFLFFGVFKKATVIYHIDDLEGFDYYEMSNHITHHLSTL